MTADNWLQLPGSRIVFNPRHIRLIILTTNDEGGVRYVIDLTRKAQFSTELADDIGAIDAWLEVRR